MTGKYVSLIGATAIGLLSTNIAHATSFATFDTGNSSELLTSLPGDDVKRVVFSVNVGSINAGDILVVDAETEMTNDTGSPSRLTAQLILGSSASATSGTELDENNNFYITPDMHHGVRVKASINGFAASSSSTYVNLVVWASPGTLTVEQDYGRLQVLKITP